MRMFTVHICSPSFDQAFPVTLKDEAMQLFSINIPPTHFLCVMNAKIHGLSSVNAVPFTYYESRETKWGQKCVGVHSPN